MIRNARVLYFVILAVLFVPCSIASADEFPAPIGKLELADGDGIVFLGDSITHQRLYTQYVEDFLYTRMPNIRLRIHNSGVGGAKAWDALQRFERDVAFYKPKYVTVLLGMNDGRYQPFNQEIYDTYQTDMTELIEQIKGIGATPILMTPTMFDARAARMRPRRNRAEDSVMLYNSVLAYYGGWLRDVAASSGYGFVDMYSPLNNLTIGQRKTDPQFTMIADAVHPGPDGQLVMAAAIVADTGLAGPVSSIQIFKNRRQRRQSVVKGGELTELNWTDNGLEFTWSAESLPWVVPADAQEGAKLSRIGFRFNRETLQISGLEPGQYELAIDGEVVDKFQATAFARRIQLQTKTTTPQYQQAAQVAELNKQRNEGPISKLRNEWRVFQQYARLKAMPESSEQADQLAKMEEQMEGREDRIAEFEKEAKSLEDQIFEINQPKARRYVITRAN